MAKSMGKSLNKTEFYLVFLGMIKSHLSVFPESYLRSRQYIKNEVPEKLMGFEAAMARFRTRETFQEIHVNQVFTHSMLHEIKEFILLRPNGLWTFVLISQWHGQNILARFRTGQQNFT